MATDTVIAEQTRVDGSVEGDTDLTLLGVIDGNLDLTAQFDIAQSGVFVGDIHAEVVDVAGVVDGTIEADDLVVLRETARVQADVSAPAIQMESGAQVAGEIDVEGEASSADTSSSTRSTSTRSTRTSRTSTTTSSTRTSASKSGQTRSRSSSSSSRSSSPASSSSSPSSSSSSGGAASSTQKATSTQTSATGTTTKRKEDAQSQTDADADSADNAADSQSDNNQDEDEQTSQSDDETSLSEMDRDQISETYTVRELRDELRNRDMKVGGTKSELINRLLSADGDTDGE